MNIQDAALFALDAYNRWEAPDDLAVPFGAKLVDQVQDGAFAAVAYYLPGTNELVFAYRGTDHELTDGLTGWPIGSGWYDSPQSQADLAFGFFNDVMADIAEPTHEYHSANTADVLFTGHSLGGGLAGLVASVNELPAFVFDAMPFTQAANKLYGDVTGPYNYLYWKNLAFPDGDVHEPSFAQIQSAALENEALAALRWGTPFGPAGGLVLTTDIESQRVVQNEIKAGTITDIYDLHSQALLTIALHGGLSHGEQRERGGDAIYKHLLDGALALKLGLADAEAMLQTLAYTVDDESTHALDSLFSDMDVLGSLLGVSNAGGEHLYADALGKLAVAHAVQTASLTGGDLRIGIIQESNGTANIDLAGVVNATGTVSDFIEFGALVPAGVFIDLDVSQVSNLAVSWSGYGGAAYLQPGGTIFFGSGYVDDIYGSNEDDIILSMGSDATFFDNVWGGGGNDVIYTSVGADTIDAGAGNDRVHGGAGNDTFVGGTGADALFGEAGNDTFTVGAAEQGDVDYIDGGAHTDTVRLTESATIRLDQARVAEIRGMVTPNGFAGPTGNGFGIEYGDSFVFGQRVETIVAEANGNTVIGNPADGLTLSGLTMIDLSASQGDEVILNGTHPSVPTLTLTTLNGVSQVAMQSLTFKGVETWTLNGDYYNSAAKTSHLALAASALAGPAVTINALGFLDMLDLSLLSTAQAGVTVSLLDPTLIFGSVTVQGIEAITGGVGADNLTGNDEANILIGGKGRDVIAGLGGADTIRDEDWVVVDYSASDLAVKITVSGYSVVGFGGHAEGDRILEQTRLDVIGSDHNDQILTGYEVWGGDGDDILHGTIIHGGDGYDTVHIRGTFTSFVDFGEGGGVLFLANNANRYDVDMQAGTYHMKAHSTDALTHSLTVLGEFNKLVGSNYSDLIHGTAGDDIIEGGLNGVDTLFGREGNDTLKVRFGTIWGGAGDDSLTSSSDAVLIGGAGADTIDGNGRGTLSYIDAPAGVSLTMVNGSGTGTHGDALGDVIVNVHGIEGSAHNDVITITMKSNSGLYAGDGNDHITVRHTSYSEVHGGDGDDVIEVLASTYGKTFGGDGNDHLEGAGQLNGDAGNDTLIGDRYAGVLDGGDGDDLFDGGKGNDTILFGAGADTFIFRTGDGKDTITGAGADDTIRLIDILAFTHFADVSERLQQVGNDVLLDFGRMSDHEDVYGASAPDDWLGALQFKGTTIDQVSAFEWEFA